MDNILKIQSELQSGSLNNSPQLCAEYRAILSGEYAFYAGQLEDILARKPAIWNVKRKDFKSDTACENWWRSTEDGINETGINLRLKRIDKMMSGLSGLQRLAEGQAKNQF